MLGVPRPSPFFATLPLLQIEQRKIKGGGLGTKLCYPNKDKTSVDSHRLFMSTAPTLDSGVE